MSTEQDLSKKVIDNSTPIERHCQSIYNQAIGHAIERIKEYQNSNLYGTIPEVLHSIINSLTKLKK